MTTTHEETWEYCAILENHEDADVFSGFVTTTRGEQKGLVLASVVYSDEGPLMAQAPAMARLLLDLEWSGRYASGCLGEGVSCCPSCDAIAPEQRSLPESYGAPGQHADDCELATVLRAAGVLP
jgi:hypothetical protein